MRIVQITPGAGGEFYCENCLRDHALVRALRGLGHDATMVPLYLPVRSDLADTSTGQAVFFGGINVYLQQKFALFRRTPRWLDRLLDSRLLLRWAARKAGMTSPADLGEETVSMLRGPQGRQDKELARLTDWLSGRDRPDVVCLSNALLIGLAGPLRRALSVPVACLLEGEDGFLDALRQPWRQRAWDLLAEKARDVDAFVSVSGYFADLMAGRMRLDRAGIRTVHTGIDLEGYAPAEAPPKPPTVGFLSPVSQSKGTDLLAEAFIRLKGQPRFADLRLRAAGGWMRRDAGFVEGLRTRLRDRGLDRDAEFHPDLPRHERQAFLRTLSVLSVPSRYPEPFGLYLLEAMASGVPVVQPEHGGYPEIIAATGGGLLHRPGDVESLAETIARVLDDKDLARRLAETGRQAVARDFSAERAAGRLAEVLQAIVG